MSGTVSTRNRNLFRIVKRTATTPRPIATVTTIVMAASGARLYRSSCSRNLQDLVYELTTAIDSRDVNRLAGIYQWTGTSTSTGYALMQRLDAIAQRPLVDIVPVYPASAGGEDDYFPQTTVRRRPIGLRLEQTLANGSTPSHTVLGLRRSFGCWWVSL